MRSRLSCKQKIEYNYVARYVNFPHETYHEYKIIHHCPSGENTMVLPIRDSFTDSEQGTQSFRNASLGHYFLNE